jgi:hypothetical protein
VGIAWSVPKNPTHHDRTTLSTSSGTTNCSNFGTTAIAVDSTITIAVSTRSISICCATTLLYVYLFVVAMERTHFGVWKRNDGFHKIPDSIFCAKLILTQFPSFFWLGTYIFIIIYIYKCVTSTASTSTTTAALPDSIRRVGKTEAFPNEYPGQNYAFNWCLNGDGVTPLKKSAFRITKPLDLKIAGLKLPAQQPLQVRVCWMERERERERVDTGRMFVYRYCAE